MRKRKKIKNIGQLFLPTGFCEGFLKGKAKRDQGSMHAHKNAGSLSTDTTFLKIGRSVFEKKNYIFL